MLFGMKTKPSHGWWLLALAALATAGCSGINATKSISPLDFLLPGLHIQNTHPAPGSLESAPALLCWDGPLAPPHLN